MAIPLSFSLPSNFVGRGDEIERFDKLLRNIISAPSLGVPFLHIYGTAGIGKSWLIRQAYMGMCHDLGIVTVYVDFEDPGFRNAAKAPFKTAVWNLLVQIADDVDSERIDQLKKEYREIITEQELGTERSRSLIDEFLRHAIREIADFAETQPVVVFVDGVEDAPGDTIDCFERDIFAPLASASRFLVVSASRAGLIETWSPEFRRRFREIHLSPLTDEEMVEYLSLLDSGVAQGLNLVQGPLAKYIRELGQNHPALTLLVAKKLRELKAANPSLVELSPDQQRALYDWLKSNYIEPYVFRFLDEEDPGRRVYEKVFLLRYLDAPMANRLMARAGLMPKTGLSADGAIRTMRRRGLVQRIPAADMYQTDPVPRRLLTRWMEGSDKTEIKELHNVVTELYKARAFPQQGEKPSPTAIVEYLYHLYQFKILDENALPGRVRIDLLQEVKRILNEPWSMDIVEPLRSRLQDDDELESVFGHELMVQIHQVLARAQPSRHELTAAVIEEQKSTLLTEAMTGNCILFLGPGLTWGPDYMTARLNLARDLAQEVSYPLAQTSLEDVAQYYAARLGRQRLEERVAAFDMQQRTMHDRDILEALVFLPFHVIVTTLADNSLEDAYAQARWPLECTNSLDARPIVNRSEDLLIHLYGSFSQPGSLIITTYDHVRLQTQLAARDKLVWQALAGRTPVFVGFSLSDPLLYTLHTISRQSRGVLGTSSYVTLDDPEPTALSNAWVNQGVVFLPESSRELIAQLQSRWRDWRSDEMRIWPKAEILEAIEKGRSLAGRNMSKVILDYGTDLQGQDLQRCTMTNSTLSGVLLNKALLSGADLSGSEIDRAQLARCQAQRVKAIWAKANGTHFEAGDFVQADFTSAVLQDAWLHEVNLSQSDLIWANLSGAKGRNANFARANLTRADLSGAQLPESNFRSALLMDANLREAILRNADLGLANLAKAQLENADLTNARFHFANLAQADFANANLDGTDFTWARLEGADFRNAHNITSATFSGAVWRDAILPPEIREDLEKASPERVGSQVLDQPWFADLCHQVFDGKCVLILGPGLSLGPDYLDVEQAMAASLGEDSGFTQGAPSLQEIAQYYAAEKGIFVLQEVFRRELEIRERPDLSSLDLIVSLPFRAVAAAAQDEALAAAYRRAERPYQVAVGPSASLQPGRDDDVIIWLYGLVTAPDSLVITQRQFLERQTELLAQETLFSKYVRGNTVLFLGFNLRDPKLYQLHAVVSASQEPGCKSCVALTSSANRELVEIWDRENLTVLDASSAVLLEALQVHWLERQETEMRDLTADAVLAIVQSGQPVSGRRMVGVNFEFGADLSGCDLHDAVMTSGTLNGVLLREAVLDGVDLRGAELEDAELSGCRANGISMIYAKANRANLNGAQLAKASMTYVALQDINLAGARLAEADLVFADLSGAFGESVDLTRTNLSNALLSGAKLPGATFTDCYMAGVECVRADLSKGNFHMANLAGARLEGANLVEANFRFADLSGADFSQADLRGATFHDARLDDADFRDARNVDEADFRGSAWHKARLPEAVRQRLEAAEAELTAV